MSQTGDDEAGDAGRAPSTRRPDGSATLADVARLAGVSPITVSRVINTPDIVSAKKRVAVRDAIDQLGYVTNMLAGSLHSRRSRLVAAVVPTIATSMFAETVEALSDRLRLAGYQVLLGLTGFTADLDREEELVTAVLSRKPDAVFLTGIAHTRRTRQQLLRAKIPVVESWDLTPNPLDIVVGFSHEAAGRAAATHLLSRGRQRFAMVSAGDERARKRRIGFVETLREAGHDAVEVIEVASPGTLASGREALRTWLARGRRFDAIFCSSDPIAEGVMTEAKAQGLAIPGDLAIIGFGDFVFAANLDPSLSTIHLDRRKLGRLAAEAILAEIEGNTLAERVVDIGFELIVRNSS